MTADDLERDEHRIRVAMRELAAQSSDVPRRRVEPVEAVSGAQKSLSRPVMWGALVGLAAATVTIVAVRETDNRSTTSETPASTDAPADPVVNESTWAGQIAQDSTVALPPAPIKGRVSPASVWTGDEFIVWGGSSLAAPEGGEVAYDDGAAFDPRTGQWRMLPLAPIPGRAYSSVVWTGSEVLIWGGSDNGSLRHDGAAYNPTTNQWRALAPAPIAARMKAATTWTGTEMIIVGGLNLDGSGGAYNPATDTWRAIADAPAPVIPPYPTAVWTGTVILVAVQGGQGPPAPMQLAAYDPAADTWSITVDPLPGQIIAAWPTSKSSTDVVVFSFVEGTDGLIVGPDGGSRGTLPGRPVSIRSASVGSGTVWTGTEFLIWSGDAGNALNPTNGTWREFESGSLAARTDGASVWADGVLLSWGGFTSLTDGSAVGDADGIAYRPPGPDDSGSGTAILPRSTQDTSANASTQPTARPNAESADSTVLPAEPSASSDSVPEGALILDQFPAALNDAQGYAYVGTAPGTTVPTSAWVQRWYTASADRPELQPRLKLASTSKAQQHAPEIRPSSGSVQSVMVQGRSGWLYDDPVRSGRVVAFESDDTVFVLTGFQVSDGELLRAAEHTSRASGGVGAAIDSEGLPAGLVERSVGTVDEGGFHPLGTLRYASASARWFNPKADGSLPADNEPMLWLGWTREDPDLFPLHRLDHDMVTDATVHGVPAFVATSAGYLAVFWSENGYTYALGGWGLEPEAVLAAANQMRPATAAEWNALQMEPGSAVAPA